MIRYIFAEDQKGVIGYKNRLPWHIKEELAYFKSQTMGHKIVMGRKTFDSMNHRLLPGRTTYVLSRQEQGEYYGAQVLSVNTLLEWSERETIDVIGGAEVFESLLPYVNVLVRSIIQKEYPGDTRMPAINYEAFSLVSKQDVTVSSGEKIRYEIWIKRGTL